MSTWINHCSHSEPTFIRIVKPRCSWIIIQCLYGSYCARINVHISKLRLLELWNTEIPGLVENLFWKSNFAFRYELFFLKTILLITYNICRKFAEAHARGAACALAHDGVGNGRELAEEGGYGSLRGTVGEYGIDVWERSRAGRRRRER